jgi:hypothetical protein
MPSFERDKESKIKQKKKNAKQGGGKPKGKNDWAKLCCSECDHELIRALVPVHGTNHTMSHSNRVLSRRNEILGEDAICIRYFCS